MSQTERKKERKTGVTCRRGKQNKNPSVAAGASPQSSHEEQEEIYSVFGGDEFDADDMAASRVAPAWEMDRQILLMERN